nr:hypothetical protein [Haloferax denitrificans]
MTGQIRRRARSLAEESSDEWAHRGADPHAVAAARVYTPAAERDWKLTQSRVAAASNNRNTLCSEY